jgi:hypothetical protein
MNSFVLEEIVEEVRPWRIVIELTLRPALPGTVIDAPDLSLRGKCRFNGGE